MTTDFAHRLAQWGPDIRSGLADLNPADLDSTYARVINLARETFDNRSAQLKARDLTQPPDWFQSEGAVGYVAYTDRFAGNLNGVIKKIPYLKSLGITYLHLMPLLQPRPGQNDGGYAVMDFRTVDPKLGSIRDLEKLAGALHDQGISLTIDLVLNHVAREHVWAERARSGESKYRDYFYIYPDRTIPDQFEETLPEVFPDFAPGNFTWDEQLNGWVWTTFNSYQWDVNWSNPDVLMEFLEIIGFLANIGIDCLRLDAIAFLWKRMGTSCQNQSEVHSITQILRAFARIVAPSMIFQAEAIVGPNDVGAYLGQGRFEGKVSDVAYHNSLMVQVWSAFAAKDARLMEIALNRFAQLPEGTAWTTYLRCHDDIGWAIDDSDAGALGWSGFGHRAFLADYYSGGFEGSPARGLVFQENPATGDRRISGSAASLAGVESALQLADPTAKKAALAEAIARVSCGYAIIFGFGGLPLIYMGDEWGLLNDYSFEQRILEAPDNRWAHRPFMPSFTEFTGDTLNVAQELSAQLTLLASARKKLPQLHAAQRSIIRSTANKAIFYILREGARGNLIQIYNVSPEKVTLDLNEFPWPMDNIDLITGRAIDIGDQIHIPGYAHWWLLPA
jgi:amylosucrase